MLDKRPADPAATATSALVNVSSAASMAVAMTRPVPLSMARKFSVRV
jgi:hypothetical protein